MAVPTELGAVIRLRVEMDAAARRLLIGGRAEFLARAMEKTVKRLLIVGSNHIQEASRAWSRSRALARSWLPKPSPETEYSVEVTERGARGTLGSKLVYARIQDQGGVVRPKKAQFLAVPLPAALTASGVPRRPGPRDWPDLFPVTTRAGNLILARRSGDGIEPMYALKRSVTLPAKGYVDAATAEMERQAAGVGEAALREEIAAEGLD